jgi:hypothetical protein
MTIPDSNAILAHMPDARHKDRAIGRQYFVSYDVSGAAERHSDLPNAGVLGRLSDLGKLLNSA